MHYSTLRQLRAKLRNSNELAHARLCLSHFGAGHGRHLFSRMHRQQSIARIFVRLAAVSGLLAGAQPGLAQTTSGTAAARVSEERAEPGDRLIVHILGEKSAADTVIVDSRGAVVLPRIGIVPIGGYAASEVPDTIRAMYGRNLRIPAVEVVVLRRVIVNGEVKKPDVYYVDLGTATVRDIIARAGGLTDAARANKVAVVRDGRATVLSDWERNQSAAADLRSGDQIIVPRRSWLSLNANWAFSTVAVISSILISYIRR